MSGYLKLAATLSESNLYHGQAYNFGPSADNNFSVADLIDAMAVYWENVRWNDISKDQQNFYEAGLLKLNCDKALFELNWKPTLTFEETVKITVEWYKHYFQNRNGAAEV